MRPHPLSSPTLLLLLVALAVACQPAAAPTAVPPREVAAPLEPVRVVYVDKSAGLLPYWAALEAGAFTRNGLGVELQPVPDVDTAYAYLLGGVAEFYLTPLDGTLVARAANGADVAVVGGERDLAIVTTRPLLAAREAVVERFLRGMLEGIYTLEARPDLARDLLAREGVAAAGAAPRERVPYLAAADLTPLIAAGAAADPRAAALDPARLLDQTVLRRLEASGFVAALYRA